MGDDSDGVGDVECGDSGVWYRVTHSQPEMVSIATGHQYILSGLRCDFLQVRKTLVEKMTSLTAWNEPEYS